MILIVTNKKDYTADFLIAELHRRNIRFLRLNTEDFPGHCKINISLNSGELSGYISYQNIFVDFSKIKSAWYRRPVSSRLPKSIEDPVALEFITEESKEVLEGLWNILDCYWVSPPHRIREAESKLLQLKEAAKLGFSVPDTLITNIEKEALALHQKYSEKIIYKPLRCSRFIRDDYFNLIFTNLLKPEHVTQLDSIEFSPSLFQPYIEKNKEIRVTVVSDRVFAVELHSQDVPEAIHDWRRIDSRKIKHTLHPLPNDLTDMCIQLVSQLGLSFGAIDLILSPSGEYIFLEINPNGQWAWIQQICPELDIRSALIDLLDR